MKIVLFIIISLFLFTYAIRSCFNFKIKENLSLSSYADIYISSVKKATDALINDSTLQCNQSNINLLALQNTANGIFDKNNYQQVITGIIDNINNDSSIISNIDNVYDTYSIGINNYKNSQNISNKINIGLIRAGTLTGITFSGNNSNPSIAINPSVQFIFVYDNNTVWTSNIMRFSGNSINVLVKNGEDNIDLPIIIPNEYYLHIIFSANLSMINVNTNMLYQKNIDNNISIYNIKKFINTGKVYKNALINKFNFNKAVTLQTYSTKEIENSFINPTNSLLNKNLISNVGIQNILYEKTLEIYSTANITLFDFRRNLNIFTNNVTSLDTELKNLQTYRNSLYNLLVRLNEFIVNNNKSIIIARNAVKNTNNYTELDIKNALGSVYTQAQNDVDNALVLKNTAEKLLNDAIKSNSSSSIINDLKNDLNNRTEDYLKTYKNLRFLLNPNNLINDRSNTTEILKLNSNLDRTKLLSIFLQYFNDNNIDINGVFKNLNTSLSISINNLNNSNTNILDVFQKVTAFIINNNIKLASDSLTVCNNVNTELNTLLNRTTNIMNSVDLNIDNFNKILLDKQKFLQNTNNSVLYFDTEIRNIYGQLKTVDLYKIVYFDYKNKVVTKYTDNIKIGTIENTGKIVKIYVFANINSWRTCIASVSYYKFYIVSTTGNVKFEKKYNLTVSPDMTFQTLVDVDIPVVKGDMFFIELNASFVLCNVTSSNIQVKLDIVTI
jgi:hypothetical protein